jgi:DNA-directed RNA polymerase subunit RPC12/RpoP
MGEEAQARRFKCDNCGAELAFDAKTAKLKCAHCGALKDVPQDGHHEVMEHDLFSGFAQAPRGFGTEVKVHRCQECGANVSFPEGVTATKCTFCGSSKVLDQSENRNVIRPESLLPFQLDKRAANDAFAKWLGKLWFRPGDLKRLAQVQDVNGVYVPFWTYDARVYSQWQAERGRYYYESEEYTAQENGQTVTKTRQVRQTSWEDAWGQRQDFYDDLLVCASQGLPPELADQFKSYNTKQLKPYAPAYLAGWRAEEYAVDLQNGWAKAQARIEAEQKNRCGRDVGGDTHRNLSVNNTYSNLTYKHVLLPVWIAAYRYQQKVYRFLVNGQTGEVVGKAPWSVIKITLFVLFWVAVLAVIIYFASRGSGS